jgi:polyhydroxybutyrate depolymerase
MKRRLSRSLLMTGLVLGITFSSVSIASAARIPTITWKVKTLAPSVSIRVDLIAASNSTGKKTWTVKGACSLKAGKIITKSKGNCSVRLSISAKNPFASRSSTRSLPIKSAPQPAIVDLYAGIAPGSTAIGVKTEGTLITPDNRTRHYRTYVPASINPEEAVPLVIGLHGGLGTSAQFEGNSGLDDLAESNHFIAVYPDGIGNQPDGTGFQTWNGGYCCGPAATQAIDDVGFVRELIHTIKDTYKIDSKRVYAMGHSNGGILAYKLACELADQLAAIGVQAGSNIVTDCVPVSPVSVIHIHGTADTNMPINGGKGSGVSGTVFFGARASVEAMARINNSNVSAPTSYITANPDVTSLSWTTTKNASEVRFVTVTGATHAWMGHPSQTPGAAAYVGEPYSNFDSTRAIVSFLLSHPKP